MPLLTTRRKASATLANLAIWPAKRITNLTEAEEYVSKLIAELPLVFAPILEQWPTFPSALANTLVSRYGHRVAAVDTLLQQMGVDESSKVGRALVTLVRKRKTGLVAIDAWKKQYPQLHTVFAVEGFEEFIVNIANCMLQNSPYVMIL